MCSAIISNILFIFLINKNILNRRAPAVKYDHGGLWPSQQQHQQDADKEMQNSDDSHSHPIDLMTPIIFRGCVLSCIIT